MAIRAMQGFALFTCFIHSVIELAQQIKCPPQTNGFKLRLTACFGRIAASIIRAYRRSTLAPSPGTPVLHGLNFIQLPLDIAKTWSSCRWHEFWFRRGVPLPNHPLSTVTRGGLIAHVLVLHALVEPPTDPTVPPRIPHPALRFCKACVNLSGYREEEAGSSSIATGVQVAADCVYPRTSTS